MARAFSPKFTAELSDNVYALTRLSTLERSIEFLSARYGSNLEFAQENLLVGQTGGPAFIKVKTAFGFVLIGKDKLDGHAFILFRGTQYLADWLSNLNVLISRSTYGKRVHDGFNQAFHSMLPQISPSVTKLPKNTVVHCLGHSLGGAIATLAVEWVKSVGYDAFLYTFGSPRVGLKDFSSHCTQKVCSDNIFRAYHKTDIVPCIPIWPFSHTPSQGRDYFINSPGTLPGAEYHAMEKYIESVAPGGMGKSWEILYADGQSQKQPFDIAVWLKNTKEKCVYSLTNFQRIEHAFAYVISKCLSLMGKTVDFVAASYATLMDRLAYVLAKGMVVEGSLSGWVSLLMRKIADFLGVLIDTKKETISEATIRGLLMKLQAKAHAMAKSALSHALANGRAI